MEGAEQESVSVCLSFNSETLITAFQNEPILIVFQFVGVVNAEIPH